MANVGAGQNVTTGLQRGETLSVVASGGEGLVWIVQNGKADSLYGGVADGAALIVGPFTAVTTIRIECSRGSIEYNRTDESGKVIDLGSVTVKPNRRLPHVVASAGDSRSEAAFLNAAQTNRNIRSGLNWANSRLGHRLIINRTYGKSGERSDQMLLRIPAAIASGAGILYIHVGVNNFAQVASAGNVTYKHAISGNVIDITKVADTLLDDVKTAATLGLLAGMDVVIENEIGSNALTTVERIAALNKYRQMLFEYGDKASGVTVHDSFSAIMQANQTGPQFKNLFSYDTGANVPTHTNGRGGFYHGKSLAPVFEKAIAQRPSVLSQGMIDVPANGRQLLTNHLFLTTSGGQSGAGITGNTPQGFSTDVTNATATLSTGANANGIGNYLQADIAFSAAGQFRLNQPLNGAAGAYNPLVTAGDILELVAAIEIVGNPANLGAISLELTANDGTKSVASFDGAAPDGTLTNLDAGPNEACSYVLRTLPVVVPPAIGPSNPFITSTLRIRSFAADNISVRCGQMILRKRNAVS